MCIRDSHSRCGTLKNEFSLLMQWPWKPSVAQNLKPFTCKGDFSIFYKQTKTNILVCRRNISILIPAYLLSLISIEMDYLQYVLLGHMFVLYHDLNTCYLLSLLNSIRGSVNISRFFWNKCWKNWSVFFDLYGQTVKSFINL